MPGALTPRRRRDRPGAPGDRSGRGHPAEGIVGARWRIDRELLDAAFEEAFEHLTDAERTGEGVRLGALRDRLGDSLMSQLAGVHETVPRAHKVAGSAHVCIKGVESEALLFLLDEAGVCASAASAVSASIAVCTS